MTGLYQVISSVSISDSDTWNIILKHTCNTTENIILPNFAHLLSPIYNHQYNSELDYHLGTALKITF